MTDESKILTAPVEVKPVAPPESRRKVAVVGEILFSGIALARELLDRGISVRALCPNEAVEQAVRQNVTQSSDPAAPTIEVIRGDLDSPQAVAAVVTGAYGVVFLSPITLTGRADRAETHVEDVRRVVNAAQNTAVRKLVYHSALGAHPKSASSALRAAAEAEMLVQMCQCEDFCVRTGLLMGPHDGFLTDILRKARVSSLFMGIMGYGGTVLQPLHVRDMARCCVSFFLPHEENIQPGIYCLAGPETITVLDLVDMTLARVGRVKLKFHAPLFVLKLLTLICKGGAFEERVNLLFDVFCTEHNDAMKLLGADQKLLTVLQTQKEII
ncbi:MAG: NAD(P)H-binding protein [Planctomycetota bacterium]